MRSVAEFDVSSALVAFGVLVLGAVGCSSSNQDDHDASAGNRASGGSAGANVSSAGRTSGGSSNGGVATGGGGAASGAATGGSVAMNGGASSTAGESSGSAGTSPSTAGNSSSGGAAGAGGTPSTTDQTVAWVLSYFGPEQSVAADSLHLAYSTDGLHWTRLGSGSPAYQLAGLGTNHIRDPFILRKHDGSFVFIATDWTLSNNDGNYWNNPSSKILVAASQDLITFSDPHLLTLTTLKGSGGKAMHAWAPESYYDAAADQYAIIWSGNDSADRNRIYISYTKDFKTTTSADPEVLFDPGYSVIDGTVATWNGAGYLFFKDETDNSGGSLTGSGKDIQVAKSSSAQLMAGAFTRVDESYIPRGTSQATRQATEGPFVIKDPKRELWYLYADFYTQGGVFGCWSTPDLNAKPNSWTRLASADYSLPAGVRHANTVRVSQAELDALKTHYE